MWTRDFYLPYVRPKASEREQLAVSQVFQFIGCAIGVGLTVYILNSVTPIQVAPAIWFGLHWKGLRGEPVLLGLIVGLAVTFGLNFSAFNVSLAAGADSNADGWSPCLVGLCCNLIVVVVGGVALDLRPSLLPVCDRLPDNARPLDLVETFGPAYDKALNPLVWAVLVLILAFIIPFYRAGDWNKPDTFVGTMASWAFTSLILSAALAFATFAAYQLLWQEYPELQKIPSPYCLPAPAGAKAVEDGPANFAAELALVSPAHGGKEAAPSPDALPLPVEVAVVAAAAPPAAAFAAPVVGAVPEAAALGAGAEWFVAPVPMGAARDESVGQLVGSA